MKNYYKSQIARVLKANPNPHGNRYRIKITGDNVETKWMNITPGELRKIKAILNRY